MKTITISGTYVAVIDVCPFCGKYPDVTVDRPGGWRGTCWAWLRCNCRVQQHLGVHRDMRWEKWGTSEIYEGRTEAEATQEALDALCEDWNKRSN